MSKMAELDAALQAKDAEIARLIAEHEAFKVKVATVAQGYAAEYNWCSVVSDALGDLGLTMPTTPRYKITAHVNVMMYVDADDIKRVQDNLIDHINVELDYNNTDDDATAEIEGWWVRAFEVEPVT